MDRAHPLHPLWRFFESRVFPIPGSHHERRPLVNPYNQEAPGLDRPGAARIRRDNLHSYLAAYPVRPRCLLVGEAPGWRGLRFSGAPFTGEAQLVSGELPFHGKLTSLGSRPYREVSATVFWRVLRPHWPAFLAWNCLPLHPHRPGEPLSNRTPSGVELDEYGPLLIELAGILQPDVVVAVGQKAQAVLASLEIDCVPVRHPAHGGAVEFQLGIEALFDRSSAG